MVGKYAHLSLFCFVLHMYIISMKKENVVCLCVIMRQRSLVLLSSLRHGTLPKRYPGHHVAHAQHGQTRQHEVGLLFW